MQVQVSIKTGMYEFSNYSCHLDPDTLEHIKPGVYENMQAIEAVKCVPKYNISQLMLPYNLLMITYSQIMANVSSLSNEHPVSSVNLNILLTISEI